MMREQNVIFGAMLEGLRELRHGAAVVQEAPGSGNSRVESGNFHITHELAERQSNSPKLQLAMDWLKEHPQDMTTGNRKLAEQLGISHSWVGKAKRMLSGDD